MALVSCSDWEAAATKALAANGSRPGTDTYFTSGAGDEVTLLRNKVAWDEWALVPRILVDVSKVSTAAKILGHAVAQPFGIAPSAFQRLLHPDGELGMTRAAIACGVAHCVSSSATTSLEDIATEAHGRGLRLMQLYARVDRSLTQQLVARAERAGFVAIVLTVDRPVLGRRDAVARAGFNLSWSDHRDPNGVGSGSSSALFDETISGALTWEDVSWLKSVTSLPVVIKGVLSPIDAARAVHEGVAAVWVSNHGGRQLDGVVAGIDVLPAIVAAVRAAEALAAAGAATAGLYPRRSRVEVWVDGGVRRGIDIIKALALGADFVFLGRPPLWGLAVDGAAGAQRVLATVGEEVLNAMQLLGVTSVGEVCREHVVRTGAMSLIDAPPAAVVKAQPRL